MTRRGTRPRRDDLGILERSSTGVKRVGERELSTGAPTPLKAVGGEECWTRGAVKFAKSRHCQ